MSVSASVSASASASASVSVSVSASVQSRAAVVVVRVVEDETRQERQETRSGCQSKDDTFGAAHRFGSANLTKSARSLMAVLPRNRPFFSRWLS